MYIRLFISLTKSVLWLLEKSDSWDSTQKHQTVYMNTEPPSYHKEIWVKSIAAQVRPGQRHNPVPRGVKSIRESLFSYYITIVLTFFGWELQSSDEWRKKKRSRRVDTKGEDLTECSYYRGVRITVKRLLASTPILYRHPYMKDVKLVPVKTGFA